MKSKFIRIILITIALILLVGSLATSAIIPYTTYTYAVDGYAMESPHAYVPLSQLISSESIKNGLDNNVNPTATQRYKDSWTDIVELADICVDNLNHVYLVDKGNSSTQGSGKIIALDENYNLRLVIDTFINDMGVPDFFDNPSGVFVTDTEILVADKLKSRIVIFDKLGNFKLIVSQPSSDVFPEKSVYNPIAVATDIAGRIYVVSSSTNYGVISLDREGNFNQFIGPQKVTFDAWKMFLRMFMTEEQKKKQIQWVPVEYNNLTIDADGFLYVTTSAIDSTNQQSAIRDKSSGYAPVKKLNPNGTDVMVRKGFFGPGGEVDIRTTTNANFSTSGASTIIDVALGPNGMWSIIDSKRSRVYTYDENGKLLFAFGDKGEQIGAIQSLIAMAYQDTKMLLLDKNTNAVTVYKRTEYGDLLAKVIQTVNDQNYDKAVDYYYEIYQANNNFDDAYLGIADSLFRNGDYVGSMQFYKYAYNTENYSKAYSEYRKSWVEDYVLLIPVVIIVFIILIAQLFRWATKVNKKGHVYKEKRTIKEELCYALHVIFHPFDGFWDLKHEKRGGIRGAIIILLSTIVVYIYQAVGRGYLFNPYNQSVSYFGQIISVLMPLALWVIANWCLTTLFDGEGTLKDIFIASCYALTPLPLLTILTVPLSNIVTNSEMGMINLVLSLSMVWMGLLIFFGMMVTHDYTLGKNVLISVCTIVGAAFIIFIAMLFTALISKIFTFGYNIYIELSLRWM